jgi:competence protein ComEC
LILKDEPPGSSFFIRDQEKRRVVTAVTTRRRRCGYVAAMVFRDVLKAWNSLRDHAALHRGLWVAAPVFWAAFSVFVHPAYGAAGFALHAALCLPRAKAAALLLAGPLLALWFAAREPALTLPSVPFHAAVPADPRDAPPRAFTGTVENFPAASARGFTFLFRTEEALYRVALESGRAPAWGSVVRLQARVEAPEAPPNPGQLDMRRVIRAQGAGAVLRADAWAEISPPPAWKPALLRARAALNASFARHVPRAGLPLLEAALLNNLRNVAPETQQAFLRSGMQHILAISGQHIGLLIAFLLALALCVHLPRKAAFVIAGILTAAYIPLTGAPVSVVRSGLMLACLLPGVLLERSSAGLHALCLTAALDLLIDPFNVLNLGFQLSYGATLALILCSRPSAALARAWFPADGRASASARAVFQMIFLSVMVTLFTYAPLAASTHAMAPWGILGNLVTVPVSSVMLVGGLCVWSLDFLLPAFLDFLAGWVGAITGFSAVLLEGCVFFLARLPGALRPVADAPGWWLAAFCVFCVAIVALLRAEKFRLGCGVAAVLVAAESVRPLLSRPGPGEARLTFLAVGHGDAAVLELPGAVLVIDAGDSPRVAEQILLPFLRHRGIARLDAVLITHPDRDHYGGAAALLDGVPAGFVLGPPEPEEKSTSWDCLRRRAESRGVAWKEGRAGQRVYAGPGVGLWMLGPGDALAQADKNDRSLVALLQIDRDASVLFTGDIEAPGQRALAETWPLWRGAWLKAPHHGSDRTTLPCFAAAAEAPRAVISCGSRRGFPGPRTVAALRGAGTRVQITKHDGAVIWAFSRKISGVFRAGERFLGLGAFPVGRRKGK